MGQDPRAVTTAPVQLSVGMYVQEYMKMLEEGWEPDLEEFVRRLPEDIQEETFEAIDRACANLDADQYVEPQAEVVVVRPEPVPEPEPMPEPAIATEELDRIAPLPDFDAEPELESEEPVRAAPSHGDRWFRWAAYFVPAMIRSELVAGLMAMRQEMRQEGTSRLMRTLASGREILEGTAQHAPLQPMPDQQTIDESWFPTAWAAGLAWRLSGPALLGGKVLGMASLIVTGFVFLGLALGYLVYMVARQRGGLWSEDQTRFANGILAGALVGVMCISLIGVATAGLIAAAAMLGSAGLAMFGIEVLVWAVTVTACAVTASGWAPEPWCPRRLVRM